MRHCLPCSTNPQMNARHLPGSWLIWKHRLQCNPAIRQPTHFPQQLAGVASWEVPAILSFRVPCHCLVTASEPGFGVHPIETPQGKVLLVGVSEWIFFPAL